MPPEGSSLYDVLVAGMYLLVVGVMGVLMDALRRYVRHRLSLWQAKHPLPINEKGELDDQA